MFNEKKIDIIRIGLQNTDVITDSTKEESEVVAGPYHPAFGQLVEDSIWYDSIVNKIKKFNVKVKEVEIRVNPMDVNHVIGHKKENAQKLKDLYEVDIKVKADENIKLGKMELEVLKTFTDFKEEIVETK